MAVHHHKLPIVTDGLEFQVDAANDLCDNVTNVKNIVTPTETGSFVNGASVVNDEYDFDGVDDYIDLNSITSNYASLTSFSISLWLNFDNTTGGSFLIFASDTTSIYFNNFIFNGKMRSLMRSSGNDWIVETTTSINTNTWYNYVITQDTVKPLIYLNGVLEPDNFIVDNDRTATINDLTIDNFSIGCNDDFVGPRSFFNGQISNSKIYNKALTQAEITQNYEATKHNFE